MVRVLVVDDSSFIRRSLTALLESDPDIKVIAVARDGEEAIAMVREHDPDLVTLDVEMPKMNGIEVLRNLKKEYPLSNIPVLMLSGLLDDATKRECIYHYGEAYVEKPVSTAALRDQIEAVLRRVGKLPPLPVAAVS